MNIPTKLTGMKPIFACLLSLVLLIPDTSDAGDALTAFSRLNNAGIIVLDSHGQTVLAQHADMPLMPASTTKLATAWMALTHWGVEHRFRTHFYLDEATQILWVKGSGDPYLVSEELDVVGRNLKQKGLKQIKGIGIDTSLFQPDLVLPGTGTTDNPYDAVPTAVSANFNTVAVRKVGGQVLSAEAHTPLTAYAESLAGSIRSGELRVNTCLLYTSPSPRDGLLSRMPSSA